MSIGKCGALVCLFCISCLPSAGQEAVENQLLSGRDPRAVTILQQTFAAMGGQMPADSVALGNVDIIEGSLQTSGTIRILTRGTDQTAEFIETGEGTRSVVFSRLRLELVREPTGSSGERESHLLGIEAALTYQSTVFPVITLGVAVSSFEYSAEYIGLEDVDGGSAHHIRLANTFAAQPRLADLAGFTVRDVWIDAATSLPRRVAYEVRESGGDAPRIPLELSFSDYREVAGILYPFRIEKKFNGTPWMTITIAQVSINSGLADDDFPVRKGAQ